MFINEHLIIVLQLLCAGELIFPQTVVLGATTSVNGNTSKNEEVSHEEDNVLPPETKTNMEGLSIVLKMPEECFTPNKRVGYCIEIKKCPALLDLLRNSSAKEFLRSSRCDPENEDILNPLVCCKKPENSNNSKGLKFPEAVDKTTSKKNVDYSKVLPNDCGHQQVIMRGRIVGGEKARLGEFPWMARLLHKNRRGEKHFGCSGFLIHSKYVLTAGHCVHRNFTVARGPVFSVVLGEHDTKTTKDCDNLICTNPLSIRRVSEVIIHEDYDPEHQTAHYNDIALLRLKSGAKISTYVKPICLNRDTAYNPTEYILSGWGRTELETVSTVKMKVTLPAVNRTSCGDQYSFVNVTLRETQICAGGQDGKDSCNGDSGGPLMFPGDNNVWFAAGIVSFGIGCGVEDWPGVYTNIPHFVPWIQNEIYKRKDHHTHDATEEPIQN